MDGRSTRTRLRASWSAHSACSPFTTDSRPLDCVTHQGHTLSIGTSCARGRETSGRFAFWPRPTSLTTFMPYAAPTPCRQPGCAAVVSIPGFCDAHRAQQHRDYGRARVRFDAELGFYASMQWRHTRSAFLVRNPVCVNCDSRDRVTVASVVDHVEPIKSGGPRFDWANLQALCVPCHNRKTRLESRTP
jgi:5-methylcytosine-specific restriction protein A